MPLLQDRELGALLSLFCLQIENYTIPATRTTAAESLWSEQFFLDQESWRHFLFPLTTSFPQKRFLPAMSQASDAHPLDPPSTKTDHKPDLLLSLPDVPTLAILSLLPLRQLIVNLPLVHPRLAPFRESVLKGTQRLVLHIGEQRKTNRLQYNSVLCLPFADHLVDSTGALLYPVTDFYTLSLATLNSHGVEQLTSLMPGIVHLQVDLSHAYHIVLLQLPILLTIWAPSLRTLTLNIGHLNFKEARLGKDASSAIASNLRALIREINCQLGALQTLTLNIRELYLDTDKFLNEGQTGVPLSLSILGQLREVYLDFGYSHSEPTFLLGQLEAYATEKLTTIALGENFEWNLNQMAASQFAGRFTILPYDKSLTSHHTTLLRSFTNLTVYEFDWTKLNALELVAHLRVLSTLPNLQCLKVSSFSPVSHPLPKLSSTDLPSLGSVRVLEISLSLNVRHNHLQSFYWETLFPSVQIVKMTHFCTMCYRVDGWFSIETRPDYAGLAPCFRQLFAPLQVLPSLRKIFHLRDWRADFIAEFTPQGEFVRIHEYKGY